MAESLGFVNWKPILPLTAAVAVIVAGFFLDHPGAKSPDSGFTVNEANQVEQMLDDIQLLHQFDVAGGGNGLTPDSGTKTM